MKLSSEWTEFVRDNPDAEGPPLTLEDLKEPEALRKIIDKADLEAKVALYQKNEFRHLLEIDTVNTAFPARDGAEVRGRVYLPRKNAKSAPLCVFFHSGGMIMGNLDSEDFECRTLAWEVGLVVFSVAYRLAPEHPFPCGPYDCFDSLAWILQDSARFHADPKQGVLLCGNSAGAQLAACTAIQAKMAHPPIHITGQILKVPTTMHYKAFPSQFAAECVGRLENAHAPLLETEEMNINQDLYGVPESQWTDPLAFPIWADPTLFPPTYVQVNSADPLRDDGLLFERSLREAGVSTRLEFFDGYPHNFEQVMPRDHPASKRVEKAMVAAANWQLSLIKDE